MRFHLPFLLALSLAASGSAQAAERSYTVTGFDRVRVEGPFKVTLRTSVAPFAKARGSTSALDSLSITVEGQTLVIRRNASAWSNDASRSGPIEIAAGTHEISRAMLNGSGKLAIDKVRGQTFELAVAGSGSGSVDHLKVDHLKVAVSGSGGAVLSGDAAEVTAVVRGAGTLDGSALKAKNATVGADGTSVLKLNSSGTVKVNGNGPVVVELTGSPACSVRADASAEISGCR